MSTRSRIINYLVEEIVDFLDDRYRLYEIYRPQLDGPLSAHMRVNNACILTVCRIIRVVAAYYERPELATQATALEDYVHDEMNMRDESDGRD